MTPRQQFRLQRAIADLCVEDILATSDEELLAEMREDGIDPDELTARLKAEFERMFSEGPK